jgi:hypothetical protein
MASWKKVLVSGSSIEIASVTSSATPTISSIGSNYVMMIDPTTGYLTKITSGNFQASLGQYAYTASAVSGTPIIIGAADTLNISGSTGLTTTISSISGGARINVSANAGSGIGIVSNTITVDTGSTHFTNGVKGTVFTNGNFVDSANIDFTTTAGTSVTAGIITGSVVNAHLQNSAVTITAGSGLTGGGSTSLGASSTLNVGAGTGITVNTDDIQLKNAGSLTNNLITKWDSGNGQLVNSGLTDDGTNLAINRTTGIIGNLGVSGNLAITGSITGSAISSSGVLTGLTVSSGTTVTAGTNIFAPNGYITAGSPGGAPNTAGAVQGQIGFFSSNVTVGGDLGVTGNTNVSGNATITGNLTVNGTTTTINTDNLLVEDRFALFASGSATATDGGLVIQAATGAGTATGFALGYSATADRWAYQDALAFNATGFGTPTAYAVTAETAAGAPAANPAYGGATYGYGNIYVNSSNGEIFIYS